MISKVRANDQHIPSLKETKVALTDKDMVERKILKSEVPQISLLLCLFHVLDGTQEDNATLCQYKDTKHTNC